MTRKLRHTIFTSLMRLKPLFFTLTRVGVNYLAIGLISIFFRGSLVAQEHIFFSRPIEKGDAQARINAVIHTAQGHIWIATETGLLHYESNKISKIRLTSPKEKSLALTNIIALAEESDTTLWIATQEALIHFHVRDGLMTKVDANDDNDPDIDENQLSGFIQTIHRTTSGALFIGTSQGLFQLVNGKVTAVFNTQDETSSIAAFAELENGDLIAAGESKGKGAFWRKSPQSNAFTQLEIETKNQIPLPDAVVSLDAIPQKGKQDNVELWFGTKKNGAYAMQLLSSPGEAVKARLTVQLTYTPKAPLSLKTSFVKALHVIKEGPNTGEVWIGTPAGLHVFDPDSKRLNLYLPNPANKYAINDDEITTFYYDHTGLLWIGTAAGGLNYYPVKKTQFTRLRHRPDGDAPMLGDDFVTAFAEFADALWLGTSHGLVKLDAKSRRPIKRYLKKTGELPSSSITSLSILNQRYLVIGTDAGVVFYSPKDKKWMTTPDDDRAEPLTEEYITTLYGDQKGRLWIGQSNGLVMISKDGNVQRFTSSYKKESSLTDDEITCIAEGKPGELWIGTMNGLNLYREETGEFKRYSETPMPGATRVNLVSNVITCLTIDEDSRLWVGTLAGITVIEQDLAIKEYTADNGLTDNAICAIQFTPKGEVWISTEKGLCRLDKRDDTITPYDDAYGIPSNVFNAGAGYRDTQGMMYFGTGKGAFYFDPETSLHRHPPVIEITAFRKFGKITQEQIPDQAHIILTYEDTFFSFDLSAREYLAPEKNRIAYRLIGVDNEWTISGGLRSASYSNLNPGSYTFEFNAANADGIWTKTPKQLHLTVIPPPWKTWWAFTLYVLLGVGSIGGLVLVKVLNDRKKLLAQAKELDAQRQVNERLQQVDKLKDEFLANTSHELRTPLNGIIGIAESLQDGACGPLNAEAQRNLSMITYSGKRLANLVNDILDFSKLKEKSIALEYKPVDMRQITEIVFSLLKPTLQGKPIAMVNAISEECPSVNGDENRIQQIMLNVVGNAFKFTDKGEVKVDAHVDGEMLKIGVHDTGIGIEESQYDKIFQSFEQGDASSTRHYGGTGIGLSITKKLVELHEGSISLTSVVGKGSSFFITLPLSSQKAEPINLTEERVSRIGGQSPSEEVLQSPIDVAHHDLQLNNGDHVDVIEQTFINGNGHIYKILVVDDEPINIQVVSNQLKLQEYQVEHASNGIEALKRFERGERFDLVLLDIMMPKMSGYDVCRKLREHYGPSQLPVILLTAKNQVTDLVEGFNVGANDYLPKPFAKKELFARIRTHISLSKITLAYGRFVPHEFLDFLNRESIVDVRLGDQVEREMTILFSDIRSFTTLSESMTPEQNFNFINSYLRRMGPIIRKHNGFIDKYIGDAIMALFPRSPDDAVRASIEMQQELQIYNGHRQSQGYIPIEIGIGLHTGKLMLGTVGDAERMEGTVIADAVNLASRLEGLTKRYGASIVISSITASKCTILNSVGHRSLGHVQVKGKEIALGIVDVYEGDTEEKKQLKHETKSRFEAALDAFYNREFETVIKEMSELNRLAPNDEAVKLYLRESERYLLESPGEEWKASTKHSEK